MRRQISLGLAILLMLITAVLTFVLATLSMGVIFPSRHYLYADMERFREVRELITRRYIGEYDGEALTDAALWAMVQALDDPWSRYLNAQQYEIHRNQTGNRQQGIGITFERVEEENHMRVIAVTPDSPAEEAGLMPGDVILTMDGAETARLETEEIRRIVTAQYGRHVTLEVRDAAGEEREVLVSVRAFYTNPVRYEMKDGNIGYLALANFDVTLGDQAIEAIESLLAQGAQSLIFDVRFNPGGRVTELLQLLDFLLPEGELFVFEDRMGDETIHYASAKYLDIPIVVLINEHSFSAAEFFAAILQESDRAQVVGMPTSGKGRSQLIFPLQWGGALQLSTSRYLTPGRVDLSEIGGITPDVSIENPEDGTDVQLAYALGLLQR